MAEKNTSMREALRAALLLAERLPKPEAQAALVYAARGCDELYPAARAEITCRLGRLGYLSEADAITTETWHETGWGAGRNPGMRLPRGVVTIYVVEIRPARSSIRALEALAR